MPTEVAVKEITTLLEDLDTEDYPDVIDYIKLVAKKRKKQRAKETLDAIKEFQDELSGDKGWNSEEEMIEDIRKFRQSRMK